MFTADQELEVAERLLTHLRDGTTDTVEEGDLRLPSWHYFDPDHAHRERAVFMRRPLLAAASSSRHAPRGGVGQVGPLLRRLGRG